MQRRLALRVILLTNVFGSLLIGRYWPGSRLSPQSDDRDLTFMCSVPGGRCHSDGWSDGAKQSGEPGLWLPFHALMLFWWLGGNTIADGTPAIGSAPSSSAVLHSRRTPW
jgi:hypothetical protein